MRFTIRVLGKELLDVDFGHDQGLRDLASVMGDMLKDIKEYNTPAEEEPAKEDESSKDAGPINHHVDADMERDVEPFDPTMGWRWDYDERGRPDKGTPDAKRRAPRERRFGFA